MNTQGSSPNAGEGWLGKSWRGQSLRTILPVSLTLILFLITIYVIAIPSMRTIAMEAEEEMITELVNTVHGLLEEYHNRVQAGELTAEDARSRAEKRVESLRYGPAGEDYFWITDLDCNMVMHPYRIDLDGRNVRDFADPSGKRLFVEFVEIVEAGGEGFVDYLWQWKGDSTRVVPKHSFVKLFEPWGWIIGTGIYKQDVYAEINEVIKKINISFALIIAAALMLTGFVIHEARVTEKGRALARQSLMASERKFRSISSSARDAIVMMDRGGEILFWNDAANKIFGFSAEEAVGGVFHELVLAPGRAVETFEALEMETAGDGDAPARGEAVEIEARRKDGSPVPVELTISPVEIDGRMNTVGIIRDISRRKEAQRKLRESRERWLLHIASTPMGFIEWDTEFRVIEWNPAAEAIFGYTREQAIGSKAFELIVPDEARPQVDKVWGALLERSGGSRSTNENVTRSGRTILCDWYNTVLVNSEGEVIGVASLVRDITEMRKAEESIRRQSAALEQAMDGVAITGLDGKIQFVNAAWARMHGYERDELIGRDVSFNHTEAQYRSEAGPLMDAAVKNSGAQGEVGHRRKDGGVFSSRMTVSVLRDGEGSAVGLLATIQDISEKKKLEAQLLQAQKVESIGRLAGGIAHDFNNLLSPILGYSDMILKDLPRDESIYEDVLEIKNAAERARDLTRQLLAFGRKQVLEFRRIDLNRVVSGVESMIRRTTREDIGIEVRLHDGQLLIEADVTQMEMILMNLAANAVDSMPRGGRLIIETNRVELEGDVVRTDARLSPGRYAILSVSDTGLGMDEDTMAHIFEPFFTTKTQGEGTGLGLSTVYGIVQQHRGQIWLYSEENIGTTFRVYIPLVDGSEHPSAEEQERPPAADGGGQTVLVVEDNTIVQNLVARILTKQGYRVISFSDPLECVEKIPSVEGEVDLLLTDVVMPGLNGRELFEKLSRWLPDLRVLYMSGYTDDVIVHRGILDEGVNYIQKPFTNNDLVAMVRKIIEGGGNGSAQA